MKFKLEIDCDNDAFKEHPGIELRKILDRIGIILSNNPDNLAIVSHYEDLTLQDSNGNTVGKVWVE